MYYGVNHGKWGPAYIFRHFKISMYFAIYEHIWTIELFQHMWANIGLYWITWLWFLMIFRWWSNFISKLQIRFLIFQHVLTCFSNNVSRRFNIQAFRNMRVYFNKMKPDFTISTFRPGFNWPGHQIQKSQSQLQLPSLKWPALLAADG